MRCVLIKRLQGGSGSGGGGGGGGGGGAADGHMQHYQKLLVSSAILKKININSLGNRNIAHLFIFYFYY